MQDRIAVVIVAAGTSSRMQGRDKLWIPLAGRIALARTIDVFEESPLIDIIVLVLNAERIADADALREREQWQKLIAIIPGGPRRQDSVRRGLDVLAGFASPPAWVMIHDGARPLVTPEIIAAGLEAGKRYGAATAAVPVKDTIKVVRDGTVHTTLDRTELWAIQTPQVFSFPLIHDAHHSAAAQADATDDAALLERLGHTVAVFPGAYSNIKITTRDDLALAETLIQQGARS
ncbi:MAG: 2-C-methyl-D-erythritol 4-phosphate cytidylyltransferase [Ktedonobacteraceae bacterium]